MAVQAGRHDDQRHKGHHRGHAPDRHPGQCPEDAGDPDRPRQDLCGQVQHNADGGLPGSPPPGDPPVLRSQPVRAMGRAPGADAQPRQKQPARPGSGP